MFAYIKPLTDTLVIEIDRSEILHLHGQIVSNTPEISMDTLLSILEAFNAGSDMSRFEPKCETCDGTVTNHDAWCEFYVESEEDKRDSTVPCPVHGYEFDLCDGKGCGYLDDEKTADVIPYANQGTPAPVPFTPKPTFRNHGEEISHALKNRMHQALGVCWCGKQHTIPEAMSLNQSD